MSQGRFDPQAILKKWRAEDNPDDLVKSSEKNILILSFANYRGERGIYEDELDRLEEWAVAVSTGALLRDMVEDGTFAIRFQEDGQPNFCLSSQAAESLPLGDPRVVQWFGEMDGAISRLNDVLAGRLPVDVTKQGEVIFPPKS